VPISSPSRPGAALLVLSLALAGCATHVQTQRAVFGPHPSEPPRALFNHVVQRVESRGFSVLDPDPSTGRFAVRSRIPSPYGRAVYRFQLYQRGWVTVDVEGGGSIDDARPGVLLPLPLHAEYAELVQNLLPPRETEDR
jgi:hypothetical protein